MPAGPPGFAGMDGDARHSGEASRGRAHMAVSAAPVNDVVDRLENAGPLDPVVNAVRGIVSKALGPQKVRDALHGVWLGHPLPPVLTDVPIGMWGAAAVLDLMPGTGPAPAVLIASGVAAAVPTAATGWAGWSPPHQPAQSGRGV